MQSKMVDVEEWRKLLMEAREMGLTVKEIENFLNLFKDSTGELIKG